MRKIFINENVTSFAGEQAELLLKERNDLAFFSESEEGIHLVPQERWELAQKYEKRTWMELSHSSNDDRNHEHLERFGHFASVKDQIACKKSIIELGCGPFTNLRLMPNIDDLQIYLLDPLINSYVNHACCPYKNSVLNNRSVTLINSSIEDCPLTDKFDVVVMINVIEHCYDANAIFDKILRMLNSDGIFIFADVYFNDVRELASNLYDAGHPLKMSEFRMNQFLKNFQPIFDQRYHKLFGQEWRNDIYFIGKRI